MACLRLSVGDLWRPNHFEALEYRLDVIMH